jgi:capsular polysaccharide biosynthesis protein
VPYAPKPLRSANLGFAVGVFAGIGLVFLLVGIDRRVRKPDEIATLLREPILRRIPKIKR